MPGIGEGIANKSSDNAAYPAKAVVATPAPIDFLSQEREDLPIILIE